MKLNFYFVWFPIIRYKWCWSTNFLKRLDAWDVFFLKVKISSFFFYLRWLLLCLPPLWLGDVLILVFGLSVWPCVCHKVCQCNSSQTQTEFCEMWSVARASYVVVHITRKFWSPNFCRSYAPLNLEIYQKSHKLPCLVSATLKLLNWKCSGQFVWQWETYVFADKNKF